MLHDAMFLFMCVLNGALLFTDVRVIIVRDLVGRRCCRPPRSERERERPRTRPGEERERETPGQGCLSRERETVLRDVA